MIEALDVLFRVREDYLWFQVSTVPCLEIFSELGIHDFHKRSMVKNKGV